MLLISLTHNAGGSILAGVGVTVVDVDITVFIGPAGQARACVVTYSILWRVNVI